MVDQALVSQKMTPEKRVAVVLASLEPEVAALVMQELDPQIMTRAAEHIRNLGIVPAHMHKKAIDESFRELQAYNTALHGGNSVAVGLLSRVVGEQQAASLLELGQEAGHRFGTLALRRPEEVARLLAGEPTSVISVIMRFLPSKFSSEVLNNMEDELRRKVVVQMATTDLPPDVVIDQIEKQLAASLPPSSARKADDSERIDAVVAIMQRSTKEVSEAMIEELNKKDPDLAALVRDQMFVFDDIARLDDSAVRRIMQDIENGVLSIALRKTTEEVKERFFSNMSRRASEGLLEEMEFAGKITFSEVLAKQKEVVALTRSLAERGDINISAQEEEYV